MAIALSALSVILMAVLYQPGKDPSRVYYGTDTRMFSILFGAALAVFWPSTQKKDDDQQKSFLLDVFGLVGMIGMGWIIFTTGSQSPFLYRGGMALFSIFTVMAMMAIVHPNSHWNRILTNKLFNWIGSRSYEIYVYQFPVFVFFADKFKDVADHQWLYAIIEIAIIIVISELSYRFIEVPLAKYDYHHVIDFFKTLFHIGKMSLDEIENWIISCFKHHLILKMAAIVVLAIGTVGIFQSTTVNPKAANHTQLANRIQKNSKSQNKHNEKLAKEIKSRKKRRTPRLIRNSKKTA
ncbi:acyltransferase [Fructilactobacillus fructivorans]|uniref:acyltransferase family protein n=1 Tax=Fructilactobacillus fructivorans TaxID=1614 RepID=UPI0026AA1BE2